MASEPLKFDPKDRSALEQRHKDTMLELVLVWATLDGLVSQLLSRVMGVSMPDGAYLIGKINGSAKLRRISDSLLGRAGGNAAAKLVQKHKKAYEKQSKPRNLIAHSHCGGVWSVDKDYVIFAVFERSGENELAVDRVPLQEMEQAIRWGRAFSEMARKILDATREP